MDEETRILVSNAKQPAKASERTACLVFIYPTGSNVGTRYTLGDRPVVIGRDDDCDIRINDDSVSRRHACVQPGADGYDVVDLQSTNGTYVNDARILHPALKDGDYLRIGNGIFRFLTGGNVEAEYHEEIYRLTIVDALTEIHNKRYFMEFLGRALSCSCRYRRPLSLVMFDIDHFKAINDELGHLGGDSTLRELAAGHQEGHPQGRPVRPLWRRGVRHRHAGDGAKRCLDRGRAAPQTRRRAPVRVRGPEVPGDHQPGGQARPWAKTG